MPRPVATETSGAVRAMGARGGAAAATGAGACVGEGFFSVRFDRVCFLDVFRALTTPSPAAAEISRVQRTRRPVSRGGILIACFGMGHSPRALYLAQSACLANFVGRLEKCSNGRLRDRSEMGQSNYRLVRTSTTHAGRVPVRPSGRGAKQQRQTNDEVEQYARRRFDIIPIIQRSLSHRPCALNS
jgi:hypothetical protein